VSPRAVAARAGVPLAATTYYFSSLDALVEAALTSLAEEWLAGDPGRHASLPEHWTTPVCWPGLRRRRLGGPARDDASLRHPVRALPAGRPLARPARGGPSPTAQRLDAQLLELLRRASPAADERAVRQVLAVLDGTVLRALAEGRPVVPAATAAVAPLLPVPRSLQDLLDAARTGPPRLTPAQALEAVRAGALLVDTRTDEQRARQGDLPGAVVVDRTVLEWRLDPDSPWRIPEATGRDVQVVVVCRQGYSSSMAAASLRALGLHRATDLAGGVEAWLAAGLPLADGPADVRT
jgi:rhodanese-related sulfurtransferase